MWKTLNELFTGSKKSVGLELKIDGTLFTGKCLADKFNHHFLAAGAPSFSASHPVYESYITSTSTNSIFMAPATDIEINNLIKCLDNAVASGYDDIKAGPIKAISHFISIPFSHICNCSLNTGIFPDKLKIARVSVIHKGGDLNNLSNYRPISVLPLFSKILEQVINKRLLNFFMQHDVIVKQQYGFQKNKSTEAALLNIKDKIIEHIEKEEFTVGIFIDFKKAFDSIKHKILLDKLTLDRKSVV